MWLFILSVALSLFVQELDSTRVLPRPRRHAVFPEGSTFSYAFCLELKSITLDFDIFTEGVAVALSYDLPSNSTRYTDPYHTSFSYFTKRSSRATMYAKIEAVLNAVGMNGRECLLRAICEGAQELSPGQGMAVEILRTILAFPEGGKLDSLEPAEHWKYLGAYKVGIGNSNCPSMFPSCGYSLVDMILSLTPVPIYRPGYRPKGHNTSP